MLPDDRWWGVDAALRVDLTHIVLDGEQVFYWCEDVGCGKEEDEEVGGEVAGCDFYGDPAGKAGSESSEGCDAEEERERDDDAEPGFEGEESCKEDADATGYPGCEDGVEPRVLLFFGGEADGEEAECEWCDAEEADAEAAEDVRAIFKEEPGDSSVDDGCANAGDDGDEVFEVCEAVG